jgi:hypothetical protein
MVGSLVSQSAINAKEWEENERKKIRFRDKSRGLGPLPLARIINPF